MTVQFICARLAAAIVLALVVVAGGCSNPRKGLETAIGGTATPGSAQDFQVNVGDRVFFTVDSSALTPDAQQILTRQSEWLKRYGQYRFVIEGHADERGTREYNLALGARRAAATRDYLIAQGVDPGRIRTVSYGKERPVAVCDDISCWNQNRRAVTALDGPAS
jgi:peptidoglycan-associated lipoprotein